MVLLNFFERLMVEFSLGPNIVPFRFLGGTLEDQQHFLQAHSLFLAKHCDVLHSCQELLIRGMLDVLCTCGIVALFCYLFDNFLVLGKVVKIAFENDPEASFGGAVLEVDSGRQI